MVDYLKEIDNGLIKKKKKIVLHWSLQKKDFFDKFKCIKSVNENYYTINIVLPGIIFINCAGLHFEKERLSEIDLFNNKNSWPESEIDNFFSEHQLVLENFFGKPSRNKLLEKFLEVNKEYKWKFRRVTIIHKLWDRFGMEEELKIYINS